MPNPQSRSADPAAREMLIRAAELGAKTVWDRHDDLKPLCGFGELGLCCDVCYMGPCRIDPFGERAQVGACGADAHLIVARNLARAVACGAAAHSDHGREVVEVFRGAAEGGSPSGYAISNPEKLMTLLAEWGVATAADLADRMAAQFGCYYDDRAGFYTAAEDGRGYPKELFVTRAAEGVAFDWSRSCFATGTETQAYDVVTAAFGGAEGALADWRDAADLYKAWAATQPWCAKRFAQRGDLPAWMKDGPALVRFGRDWLSDPERIESWLTKFWQPNFPKMPLVTAYWGWEKHADWVTPDYFPLFPSDEQFKQLVAKSRAQGCHAFPWPSGYHWTLTYTKRSDGGFEWDDRARFDKLAKPHAVCNRDGGLYIRTPGWLNGGDTACLCGGDPWTIDWWNKEICAPLAERG